MFRSIVLGLHEGECTPSMLELTLELARLSGAHLSVLWIHEPIGHLAEVPRPVLPPDSEDAKRFDEFKSEIFEQLSGSGVRASVYLLTGRFAREVPRFAEERRADLVMLAERKERGLFGPSDHPDVARVRRRVKCHVLIIKPVAEPERWADRPRYAE